MNRICILLAASLSAFTSLKAVIISANHWSNNSKHVLVLGEAHCDFEDNVTDPLVIGDKLQQSCVRKAFEVWAKSGTKIAFLPEASQDFITLCTPTYTFVTKSTLANNIYIGMHVAVPFFACDHAFHYGNLDFIFTDWRTTAIMAGSQFFMNLNCLTAKVPVEEIFTHPRYEKHMLEGTGVSIKDYLTSFDTTINRLQNHISQEKHAQLLAYKQKARDFFSTHAPHVEQHVGECFLAIGRTKGYDYVVKHIYDGWIAVGRVIADESLTVCLTEALKKYDHMIVFGGHLHALALNTILAHKQFTCQSAQGPQQQIAVSDIPKHILSVSTLQTLLDTLNQQLPFARICQKCSKQETPQETLKHCGTCKKVLYCSRNCQAADWTVHKLMCNS